VSLFGLFHPFTAGTRVQTRMSAYASRQGRFEISLVCGIRSLDREDVVASFTLGLRLKKLVWLFIFFCYNVVVLDSYMKIQFHPSWF
jgi:hypothetical protein